MRLTRRGYIVAFIAAGLILAGLLFLVDHVNYMGNGSWCFHDSITCYFGSN
jgi:hypothetical protein